MHDASTSGNTGYTRTNQKIHRKEIKKADSQNVRYEPPKICERKSWTYCKNESKPRIPRRFLQLMPFWGARIEAHEKYVNRKLRDTMLSETLPKLLH